MVNTSKSVPFCFFFLSLWVSLFLHSYVQFLTANLRNGLHAWLIAKMLYSSLHLSLLLGHQVLELHARQQPGFSYNHEKQDACQAWAETVQTLSLFITLTWEAGGRVTWWPVTRAAMMLTARRRAISTTDTAAFLLLMPPQKLWVIRTKLIHISCTALVFITVVKVYLTEQD